MSIESGSTFSVRPFGTIAIAPTTLTVAENAVITRDGNTSATADATISLASNATVTGQGTINLPVAFNEVGSVLDTVTAIPLQLNGTVTGKIKVKLASGITTAKEILVTDPSVKLDRVMQLAFADNATSQQYKTDNFCFVESVFDSRHTFTVSAPLTLTSLPDSVTDSEVARNAIYAAFASIRDTSSVTTIKEIDARSTTYEVLTTSRADALVLFENLSAWAELITGDGAVAGEGKVVVMYDFGISQLLVKNASLVGAAEAKLYVLLCAKVSNGKAEEATAAGYATGTTVSLLLDGTEAIGAVALDTATLSDKFGLSAGLGERWFALPMKKLALGTRKFTVRAINTPQAEVTP